jgi:AcrR family transcriptional regulator
MQQESKGQITKNNILREGLLLASVKGLVNISIGGLAEKAQMSRSGLFAHFMSKEQLQLEILEYANQIFQETVIRPCQQFESPRERLRFLARKLPAWYEESEPKIPGGCIFLTACMEFDDRPGNVKNYLMEIQLNFLNLLKQYHQEAVAKGEFTHILDEEGFAFVFNSFYMGYHQYRNFFGDEKARAHVDRHLGGLIEYASGNPANTGKEHIY